MAGSGGSPNGGFDQTWQEIVDGFSRVPSSRIGPDIEQLPEEGPGQASGVGPTELGKSPLIKFIETAAAVGAVAFLVAVLAAYAIISERRNAAPPGAGDPTPGSSAPGQTIPPAPGE